jgi:hypothetical protein
MKMQMSLAVPVTAGLLLATAIQGHAQTQPQARRKALARSDAVQRHEARRCIGVARGQLGHVARACERCAVSGTAELTTIISTAALRVRRRNRIFL